MRELRTHEGADLRFVEPVAGAELRRTERGGKILRAQGFQNSAPSSDQRSVRATSTPRFSVTVQAASALARTAKICAAALWGEPHKAISSTVRIGMIRLVFMNSSIYPFTP